MLNNNNNIPHPFEHHAIPTKPSCSSSASSTPTSPSHNPIDRVHRRILSQATAAICQTTGFDSIQSNGLEQLASIAHKFLNDICRCSREHCEQTGRSIVTPGDVFMALVNSGLDVENFSEFLNSIRHSRPYQFTLKCQSPVKSPPVLRISEPRPHPSHFPGFLPTFPDPHTYIRTEVKDDIDSNYEKVRRMTAQNRRDIENSLVNYALSVYPSICLFQELAKRLQFEAKDKLDQNCKGPHQNDQQPKSNQTNNDGNGTNGEEAESPLVLENGDSQQQQTEEQSQGQSEKTIEKNNSSGQWTKNNGIGANSKRPSMSSNIQDLLFSEEQFRLKETERSYILKRIPPSCHVLLPFDDKKPCISALITDDIDTEEEHNYFAQILSKEMEEDMAENEEEMAMEIGLPGE